MGCYTCIYLDSNKKEAGKVAGNLYYCDKLKKFVNPCNNSCGNYEESYNRIRHQKDELYYIMKGKIKIMTLQILDEPYLP